MADFNFTGIEPAEGCKPGTPEFTRYLALRDEFNHIVHERNQTVADDQCNDYTPPLTQAELQTAAAVAYAAMVLLSPSMRGKTFTCSECGAAPVCPLAFDYYNTDGDCLMEK